jgi:hypothetical protein
MRDRSLGTDDLPMPDTPSAGDRAGRLRPAGLHVCVACTSELVQLTAFEDAGDNR